MTSSQPPLPAAVYVWSLDLARTATRCASELQRPLLLLCPQESAAFGGVPWFETLVRQARQETGARALAGLEAGEDGALAHEALRAGLDVVIFTGPNATRQRLAAIAREQGAVLLSEAPAALTLAVEPHPIEACRAWLHSQPPPEI